MNNLSVIKRELSPSHIPRPLPLVEFGELCDVFEIHNSKGRDHRAYYKAILFGDKPTTIHIPHDQYKIDKGSNAYCRTDGTRLTPVDSFDHQPPLSMAFTNVARHLDSVKKQSHNGVHFTIEGAPRSPNTIQITFAAVNGENLTHDWKKFMDQARLAKETLPKGNWFDRELFWWKIYR